MITKEFPDSRMVRSLSYNEEAQQLHITFNTGKTYQYESVPMSVVKEALAAESIGQFVNQRIKSQYLHKLIN